jgi:phosphoribosylformylglycinamidine synthase
MQKDVIVTISLKEGISDPEGKNVKKALSLLGFQEVSAVTVQKRYKITMDVADEAEAETRVKAMAEQLLSNPVVHNYEIAW